MIPFCKFGFKTILALVFIPVFYLTGGDNKLPGPDTAAEGGRRTAVWGTTLPGLQRHESIQLSRVLKVQGEC